MSAPAPAPFSDFPSFIVDIPTFPPFSSIGYASSGGHSSAGPVIGVVLFIVVFIIGLTISYFKAVSGCQDLHMQLSTLQPDPETVDATIDRFLNNMAKEKPHRYTSQQLASYTRNYFHKLGSGGFGIVYRGLLPEGVPIAVKVLNNNLTKQVEEQFMAEVNSIGRTYHINLVKLYGYCFEPKLKALVYEFMPNGSLDHVLFGGAEKPDWVRLHRIAVGTAKGIAYLHEECEQKIIHHDIKPGNVLLDSGMNPKVADFGLARLINRESSHVVMSGFKGTPGYAAPEVWTSYVTHKCDVYSYGMMLFEMLGRRKNHVREMSGMSKEWFPRWTYQKVRDGEVAEVMAECGVVEEAGKEVVERAVKVALWCVQYSPGARPEMSVVVKMLEGGMEVAQPPNPFGYLEQTFEFGGTSSTACLSSEQEGEIEKCDTYPRLEERRIDVQFNSC